MASQHKIQAYMDKHRIEVMFEDLMNKVLRDMPEDPNIYLLRALYKKSGMEIPQEIRFGGMRKSTDFGRSRTPDRGRKGHTSSSTDDGLNRAYDKPWKTSPSPNRRSGTKPKLDDQRPVKRNGQKSDWNTDVRVKSTSFDDLFEDQSQPRREVPIATKKRDQSPDKRTSWASIGFGSEKTNVYSSNNYSGPRGSRFHDDDPLANELRPVASSQSESRSQRSQVNSSGHIKGPRVSAKKHRKDLQKLLNKSDDSGYDADDTPAQAEDDEAIELLEDSEELLKEGARNVSKEGFKLSRVSRQRIIEPKVKLNINFNPLSSVYSSSNDIGKSPGFNVDDSDTEDRPQTGRRVPLDSDDEFESISQVTGPREPVWKLRDPADSDVETYAVKVQPMTVKSGRHSYDSRLSGRKTNMASTLPVRFSTQSGSDFLSRGGQTWTGGLDEERGGWEVPYDSDGSQTDLTQTTRSKPSRDPRAGLTGILSEDDLFKAIGLSYADRDQNPQQPFVRRNQANDCMSNRTIVSLIFGFFNHFRQCFE
ncbi:hypothetical protein LOTGIDRAFT_235794 [Lottia gigantea]|uniref:Uncharacterized protein n=1 Tax=Lottia gigantea TaxID=225164 RepID=V3Z3Q9_LOTGI|nr:hypothetical protein LOTGIDRAFT_235794 [Lottia gigantea]ESO85283.1 hypothetical protein LOTGIDRAFT_235794 [Lottia gigantea]